MGGEQQAVRRDKCAELADSLNWYKWEPHEKQFIEKIKDMQFDFLGAKDQEQALTMLEVLYESH